MQSWHAFGDQLSAQRRGQLDPGRAESSAVLGQRQRWSLTRSALGRPVLELGEHLRRGDRHDPGSSGTSQPRLTTGPATAGSLGPRNSWAIAKSLRPGSCGRRGRVHFQVRRTRVPVREGVTPTRSPRAGNEPHQFFRVGQSSRVRHPLPVGVSGIAADREDVASRSRVPADDVAQLGHRWFTAVRCAIGVSVVSFAIRPVVRMVWSRVDPPAP